MKKSQDILKDAYIDYFNIYWCIQLPSVKTKEEAEEILRKLTVEVERS